MAGFGLQGGTVHPFLTDEFLFDWSRLTPAQVEPDTRAALAQSRERVAAFKRLTGAELTYANVLLGFEAATRDLSRAWGLVSHLDSVLNSPDLRKAYGAMLPEVTAYFTSLTLDPEIWAVFKAYAATAEAGALTGVRRRFLDETMADFLENGADLPAAQKDRLAAINASLAEKTQKYSENVLDSTNAWELFVDDERRLAGLPASALAAAKQSATTKGKPEAWRFTLQQPSVYPVLQYAQDADLRRQCWEGLGQVGLKEGCDNTALVGEILALRHEKAACSARPISPTSPPRVAWPARAPKRWVSSRISGRASARNSKPRRPSSKPTAPARSATPCVRCTRGSSVSSLSGCAGNCMGSTTRRSVRGSRSTA